MTATPTFAAFLKAAREKTSLTQAALASRCRLTGSYISLLESGKKPAPSDGVVRRLAHALELDTEEALRVAHLDRAPRDIRAAVDRLRRQAALERDLREKTAEALFPLSLWSLHPAGLSPRLRGPRAASLGARIVEALEHLVDLARSSPDPRAFRSRSKAVFDGLTAEERRKVIEAAPALFEVPAAPGGVRLVRAPAPGLPPEVLPGDTLAVDPSLEPREGDLVVIGEGEGESVRRWTKGKEGVRGVVTEVRRRLR